MNKLVLAALITTVSAAPFAAFAANVAKSTESAPVAAPATAPVATTVTTPTPAATPDIKKEEVKKEEVKTVAGELKDGTKIETTGDKVEVIGKDGKKSPAPDGEHTMKDGSTITTKGGMIVKK